MTANPTLDRNHFRDDLRKLVDRTANHRHIHTLLVAVETDDQSISARLAAGDAQPDDPYFIASIAKMYTATIVIQLIDEHRLQMNDRVVDLLPHLDLAGLHRHRNVDHTDQIEVHHLLHQTSGLHDYFAGGLQEDFIRGRDHSYTIGDVVDMARTTTAEFPPGDRNGRRSAYSDTNYQLLTAIIETTTGHSYQQAVRDRIAEPLDLAHTYVFDRSATPRRGAPLPLHHKDQVLSLPNALASEQGAGGIVSTLGDQLRFQRAYHSGQLFDPSHHDRMRRWNRIFFPIDYGHGLMRYQLPRWMTGFRPSGELIGHSGATGSFAFYAPDNHCHIVGTFNQFHKPARPFRFMTQINELVRRAQPPA